MPVRISLSPFYFVVTIYRPAELQWSLGHRNRGIKAKADNRAWGEEGREKKAGYGVVEGKKFGVVSTSRDETTEEGRRKGCESNLDCCVVESP